MGFNKELGDRVMQILPAETEREAKLMLIIIWVIFMCGATMIYAEMLHGRYSVVKDAYNDLQLCSNAVEIMKPGVIDSAMLHPDLRMMSLQERKDKVMEYCGGYEGYLEYKNSEPLYFEE